MDALTTKFDQIRDHPAINKAVKYGVKRGQAVLDKYYSKTDESVLYRIALRKLCCISRRLRRSDALAYPNVFDFISPTSWLPSRIHASQGVACRVDQ